MLNASLLQISKIMQCLLPSFPELCDNHILSHLSFPIKDLSLFILEVDVTSWIMRNILIQYVLFFINPIIVLLYSFPDLFQLVYLNGAVCIINSVH